MASSKGRFRSAILILAVYSTSISMTNSLMSPTRTRSTKSPRSKSNSDQTHSWSTRKSSSLSLADSHSNVSNDEERPLCQPLEMEETQNFPLSSVKSLLGGASSSSEVSSRKKLIMNLALFSTYFTVMGAKCALPSTFNQLTSSNSGLKYNHDPQQLISTMLFFSTGAISFGKFVLGPIIDKVGGVACLKVALSLLMAALGVIASTQSFIIFAIAWVCVDFIFSSCWAACLNAIHHTFQEEEWANRIGLIAVAGRVGNVSSFFMFATVLQWAKHRQGDKSWRLIFWISSVIQLIPLFMLTWFEKVSSGETVAVIDIANTQQAVETESVKQDSPTIGDSLRILKEESKRLAFWMHLVSRSSLMIIASFLLFVPSYMANSFGMTESASARVGALYALGSLLSVTFGAKSFSASSRQSKILSTIVLLGSLVVCSLLHLAHITGSLVLSPLAGAASMFIWGITFSIPFYIPPSMYALKRGGEKSSATIADAFDFVGFMLLAWFNGFVAARPQDILSSWIDPYRVLLGFSLTALVTSIVAIVTE